MEPGSHLCDSLRLRDSFAGRYGHVAVTKHLKETREERVVLWFQNSSLRHVVIRAARMPVCEPAYQGLSTEISGPA